MTTGLTAQQQARFAADGYLSPLRVFSTQQAAALRAEFEAFELRYGGAAVGMRTDLHLLQRWAWDVVHDPRIVAPVVDLLGPDVLLWSMNWFIKEPGEGKLVSLHQDANYWGLAPHEVVTAWLALSDAGEATGPMKFLPGSHRQNLLAHDDTFAPDNLLTRGQTVAEPIDETACKLAPLRAGEMSLHHVRIVHGSAPNMTDDRRIGMVLRFCATCVRQTKAPDTAVLVAGQDNYGHFELLVPPETDFGASELERHADAVQRMGKIIMMD